MKFRQFLLLAESDFRFEGESAGIITGYNPNGKQASVSRNRRLNKSLWNELRAAGYDPWAIQGNYKGAREHSFLVPDIARADIIKYGNKYEQEAVVWAKKGDKGYEVEWIEGGKTTKKAHVASIRSLISQSIPF